MYLDLLYRSSEHFSVKEHKPGLIKIKVKASFLSDPAFKNLPDFDKLPHGITNVDFNIFSRTVSISYDTGVIPKDLLDELLTTEDKERGSALLKELEERMQQTG
jgi:hypothetical protein